MATWVEAGSVPEAGEFERPLRPVAPLAQLEFEEQTTTVTTTVTVVAADSAPDASPVATPRSRRKPVIPAWEDVLLGVRTSGER